MGMVDEKQERYLDKQEVAHELCAALETAVKLMGELVADNPKMKANIVAAISEGNHAIEGYEELYTESEEEEV